MKVVAQNRRARFDYEILDTVEAGIILTGPEVKSCRMGHADLSGAYVSFTNGKPMVKHMKIAPYQYASPVANAEPDRDRQLLLKKGEWERLAAAANEKGISIIPLEVRAGKFIKLVLGAGRGRKRLDKRHRIREREIGRRLREGKDV
ncbi:MAG: SsrA-binding protein SmpB [Candidatus Peregrinibacteria bacterium]|nr:SsrA-binding protein SmpB [Candidatus Peregrinibacteria bacterium]